MSESDKHLQTGSNLEVVNRKRAATHHKTPSGILSIVTSDEFLENKIQKEKPTLNPLNLGFGMYSEPNSLNSSSNQIFSQSFKRQSTKLIQSNLRNHTIETQKSVYKPNITSKELKNIVKENNNTDTDSENVRKKKKNFFLLLRWRKQ